VEEGPGTVVEGKVDGPEHCDWVLDYPVGSWVEEGMWT